MKTKELNQILKFAREGFVTNSNTVEALIAYIKKLKRALKAK